MLSVRNLMRSRVRQCRKEVVVDGDGFQLSTGAFFFGKTHTRRHHRRWRGLRGTRSHANWKTQTGFLCHFIPVEEIGHLISSHMPMWSLVGGFPTPRPTAGCSPFLPFRLGLIFHIMHLHSTPETWTQHDKSQCLDVMLYLVLKNKLMFSGFLFIFLENRTKYNNIKKANVNFWTFWFIVYLFILILALFLPATTLPQSKHKLTFWVEMSNNYIVFAIFIQLPRPVPSVPSALQKSLSV